MAMRWLRCAMRLMVPLFAMLPAHATSPYDAHVIFDNSRADHSYYYSSVQAIGPSEVDAIEGHLPLATEQAHSPPNSLRLRWTSRSGGDWYVGLGAHRDTLRSNEFSGDALILWAYSPDGLGLADSPRILLKDAQRNSTPEIALLSPIQALAPHAWTRIVLPLKDFRGLFQDTGEVHFELKHLERIVLSQNTDDGVPHTLYLDDIRVGFAAASESPPPAMPTAVFATGFEQHIEVQWAASDSPTVESYRIYRAAGPAGDFREIGEQRAPYRRYEDFLGVGQQARYQVRAVDTDGRESAASATVDARTRPMSDEELLTMVQQGNFRYYWDGAHPNAGMAVEIYPGNEEQVALGASGFGLMALIVGMERGFITREQGIERVQKILGFLQRADRYHGAWAHFLDGRNARTMAEFGPYDDGGDLVETSFLMQGLLAMRQYLDRKNPAELAIRSTITALWEGVEWDWYRDPEGGDFLLWHWSPDHGFYVHHRLVGWNETLITYLLAIASPTHPAPASLWYSGWASQSEWAVDYRRNWSKTREGDHFANGQSYYGIPLAVGEGNGAELFFTQFSFLGFDARGIRDRYADYFDNNRAIVRIQHAYALDNPRHCLGYGEDAWGKSVGSHAGGGRARPADDNCTLEIHAALGSMPYAPAESLAALRHYYRDLGAKLWGAYGFTDSFNATQEWYDETYRGLNQAQTVVMIENYRSGLLWRLFMRNPEIAPALNRIGFKPESSHPAIHH